MVYIKRLVEVLLFIPRIVLAFIFVVILWPIDLFAIPIYYVLTGKHYTNKYTPLSVNIGFWVIGLKFKWKD